MPNIGCMEDNPLVALLVLTVAGVGAWFYLYGPRRKGGPPRRQRTSSAPPPTNTARGNSVADGVRLGFGGCVVMPLMLGLLVVLVLVLLILIRSF